MKTLPNILLTLTIGLGTALLPACSTTPSHARTAPTAPNAGDVLIEQIAPDVWMHTTYMTLPEWGTFPSNGLIVRGDSGCIVIDTGCSPDDMAKVCEWTENSIGPVLAAVITHSHNDCIGGIDEAHARNIQTIALEETILFAKEAGVTTPNVSFQDQYTLEAFGIAGECFYPGPGHTTDNIVVWLEDSRVLFGGCLVRPGDAQTLGNVADADIAQWPNSINTLIQRYPDVQIVVPGHMSAGDRELLEHSHALTKSHAEAMP